MRIAISIPDEVFSRAEQSARQRKMTRSALYSAAVEAYLSRHRQEDVTRRLNEVYSEEDSALDPVLACLQFFSLPKEEW